MADVTDMDSEHAASLGRRYLIRFEEDTLRQRPLWIRLIIEFLGTFVLVTVAAGSGVINHYVGGGPISRTAAVIAPGAVVMAMIYAWGPLSGLHINPAVTFGFTARGVFPRKWVVPYWVVQFAGAICAALVPAADVRGCERGRELPDHHARRGVEVAGDGDRAHRDPGQSSSSTPPPAAGASATTPRSRSAPRSRCSACSPARSAARR